MGFPTETPEEDDDEQSPLGHSSLRASEKGLVFHVSPGPIADRCMRSSWVHKVGAEH